MRKYICEIFSLFLNMDIILVRKKKRKFNLETVKRDVKDLWSDFYLRYSNSVFQYNYSATGNEIKKCIFCLHFNFILLYLIFWSEAITKRGPLKNIVQLL